MLQIYSHFRFLAEGEAIFFRQVVVQFEATVYIYIYIYICVCVCVYIQMKGNSKLQC